MCRPSKIDGRCEIRLLYLLKTLILYISCMRITPRVCTSVLSFLEHLKNNLGNEFEHFKNCDIAGKSHFILGTELWGSRYEELLRLVKSYIIDIWELRKSKLYGSGTGPLQYRSRPGRDTTCQGKGKFGKLGGEN